MANDENPAASAGWGADRIAGYDGEPRAADARSAGRANTSRAMGVARTGAAGPSRTRPPLRLRLA